MKDTEETIHKTKSIWYGLWYESLRTIPALHTLHMDFALANIGWETLIKCIMILPHNFLLLETKIPAAQQPTSRREKMGKLFEVRS